MKPIGVLVNPAANRGRGNQVGEQVFHQLSKAGIPAINLSAESAIAAASKAQVAISDQEISGVIAVGGDGTAQLGVNICVPNQIPLGIVPAGTGNDQARELKIPLGDPAAAIENILASLDAPKRVDVMRVVTGEREFWSFGSISAGFDAICAKRANGLKWPKGPNSYVAAMLLEIFPTVYKGEHVKFPEIEIFKAKSIRLENDNYPISCDGEIVGHAPFSVEIHPGALQVFSA